MNKRNAFGIVLLLFSTFAFGQDIELEFIEKAETSYLKMKTLTSDFTQRKSLSFLEEDMLSSGQFYFVKPGIMKWDQKDPEAYYFIINEKEIIRFNGQKRQKIPAGSPQAMIFREFIIGTVDGSIFQDLRFESTYSIDKKQYRVELTPLDKNIAKRIEKIILFFEMDSLFLNTMVLIEAAGDKSEIYFTNQKLNEELNMDIFD